MSLQGLIQLGGSFGGTSLITSADGCVEHPNILWAKIATIRLNKFFDDLRHFFCDNTNLLHNFFFGNNHYFGCLTSLFPLQSGRLDRIVLMLDCICLRLNNNAIATSVVNHS